SVSAQGLACFDVVNDAGNAEPNYRAVGPADTELGSEWSTLTRGGFKVGNSLIAILLLDHRPAGFKAGDSSLWRKTCHREYLWRPHYVICSGVPLPRARARACECKP